MARSSARRSAANGSGIHVDVREVVAPALWVYREGRAVVVTDPFHEVAHG